MMLRTAKEFSLLKDMKNEEKLCTDKFEKHAKEKTDPQLKELFNSMAQTERCHYEAVCKMEQGEVPDVCIVSAKSGKRFQQHPATKKPILFFAQMLFQMKNTFHICSIPVFLSLMTSLPEQL